jgi:enamine deaminase RidA (YjgF/YER057c/UK114 family)
LPIQRVSSGGKYEEMVGYSRAVRTGDLIFVSGTGSINPTRSAGEDEAYLQSKEAIATIEQALEKLGASLSDVVRTRVFVRSDVDWHKVSKAHREAFGEAKPASTWLVGMFLDPNLMVEIEVDAVVGSGN